MKDIIMRYIVFTLIIVVSAFSIYAQEDKEVKPDKIEITAGIFIDEKIEVVSPITLTEIEKSAFYTADGGVYFLVTNTASSGGFYTPVTTDAGGHTLVMKRKIARSWNFGSFNARMQGRKPEILFSAIKGHSRHKATGEYNLAAIRLADATSKGFKLIEGHYGSFGKHVFFKYNKLDNADVASFKLFKERTLRSIAFDKNKVYMDGEVLYKADPKTLEIVKTAVRGVQGHYLKDANNVYTDRRQIVEGADPVTFKILTYQYSVDKNHVFAHEKMLKADLATFEIVDDSYWAKDKDYVWYQGAFMKDFEAKTFEVLKSAQNHSTYVRDKDTIYHSWQKLEGVDLETFQVMKDKSQTYDAYDKDYYYTRGVKKSKRKF